MRILLVEDESDVRQFLARAISHLVPGYVVVATANGAEALERFRNEEFDLIISDHRMPVMTGVALLRAVRADSDVPFVIITADRAVEAEAYANGVNELLNKPISLDGLRDAINRQLKR